eukprot:TRINITY_DN577_c0_g2_i1.p1 TRINITY_DN577_c0_g2~~TRINITY_DN577_c0_g2_i1.p1  ORF type:complete len:255 (+),score=58.67 TRINITY_DN577_c0_g2_i1:73-837(+)
MSDGIPDSVKQQVMQDPKVQAAIKEQAMKAGTDAATALKDPKVQEQILNTLKEKGPEYASAAKAKIMEFASDPEVQRQAKMYANQAGQYALNAGGALVAQIEQGPAGVRFLSFLGGCASVANGVLGLLDIGRIIGHPVLYVLSFYQMLFSLTTMLFEAPPEYVAKVPGLNGYQDMLMEKAKFLSETLGRGIFYIFQGTLWLAFASLAHPLNLAVGLWMVFVGFLTVLIHFGGLQSFAEKVRSGYTAVGGSGGQP